MEEAFKNVSIQNEPHEFMLSTAGSSTSEPLVFKADLMS